MALSPVMDERVRRHWAATEAMALGWGGISAVAAATGLARNTVAAGVRELAQRGEHESMLVSMFACDGLGEGVSRSQKPIRCCCVLSKNWSIRPHAAILSLRCVGHARAQRSWRRNSRSRIILLLTAP